VADALFDMTPVALPEPEPAPKVTAGAKLRARQAARIRSGMHPLALAFPMLRLHPDAARVESDDRERGALRCGSCVHRRQVAGGARDFPKCLYGMTITPIPEAERVKYGPTRVVRTPRVTHGPATDVRAWWPACVNYEQEAADA
jgi:hypothetical protein